MVQGYYTLDEAARILGMDPDKLSQMAQRREIRAFADRGTWRFRTQDVHELARRSGLGSDPELQLGEAPSGKGAGKLPVDEVFDFALNPLDGGSSDEHQVVIDSPSNSKFTNKPATPAPATPKPGSDSDVHLVFDVTDDLVIANDSDVKLEEAGPTSKPSSSRKTPKSGDGPNRSDSGVRLVPMEEEPAHVPARQPTPSDSDIRLEPAGGHRGGAGHDTAMTTEEINLDEELLKEAAAKIKREGKTGPEELKIFGLQEEPKGAKPGQAPKTPSPSSRKGKETQIQPVPEDEVSLGDLEIPAGLTGATSGINLHSPADSGINLAKAGDSSEESLEFQLSPEDKQATPKPAPAAADKDDSSGEFELTLDDTGGLAPIEEEHAPQESGEKDIFETDFDMPALDEESGSEAVALEEADTDLESSDFDLTMGEEESGSQVVSLDEEEADEGAATVARGARGRAALDADELEAVDEDEDEAEVAPRRAATVAAAPAHWGVLPFAMMAPTVIIMFIACLMSFELLHGMWGYKQSYKPTGPIVQTLAKWFNEKVPE